METDSGPRQEAPREDNQRDMTLVTGPMEVDLTTVDESEGPPSQPWGQNRGSPCSESRQTCLLHAVKREQT